MIKIERIPPPPVRQRVPRLTADMRSMQPGDSFAADADTVAAFTAFARYQGWSTRRRKDGETIRVWRVS